MDDKTAIACLRAYEDDDPATMPEYSVHMESIAHAINAIETLAKVREIVAAWKAFETLPDYAMERLEKLLEVKP